MMSRTSSLSTSIPKVNPPHPGFFSGRHATLKKYANSKNPFLPNAFRLTCTRCGYWEEHDLHLGLLLTSRN